MKDLIDALGGAPKVAKELNLTTSRVGNWTVRGIPWRYRPAIAQLAKKQSVKLPPDFLHEAA